MNFFDHEGFAGDRHPKPVMDKDMNSMTRPSDHRLRWRSLPAIGVFLISREITDAINKNAS
jgi:hypothetical protein